MKLIIILGCALVALADRFRGRPVAINSAFTEAAPAGLSSTARAARTTALVAAGVPQLYAEKFATDAVEAQAWHDNPNVRQGEQASPLTPAEQEAKAIATAHTVDPSAAAAPVSKSQRAAQESAIADAQEAAEKLAGKAASDREAAERLHAEVKTARAEIAAAQSKAAADRKAAEKSLADAQATLAKFEAAKAADAKAAAARAGANQQEGGK